MDGGVFGLLGLIAAHRGAVEYDLRHRFQIGLSDVGVRVSVFEVARLVEILREDPSSCTAAALAGWKHPISREALILMDLFDLDVSINTDRKKGKPKPHPGRPFELGGQKEQRYGDAAGRTREEVLAILNAHGHSLS